MENKVLGIISYDGSKFSGMQIQPDKKTVQGEIQKALIKLNINSSIQHAGRTDTGVHALNQVISFNVPKFWEINKLQKSLNKILHPYIHIKKLSITDDNFHPRFNAKKRSYRYILTPHFSPHTADYTTFYPKVINIELLKKALKTLEGKHDFEYFAKTGSEVNNYIREIYETKIFNYRGKTIIKIIGNGFLRGQIRIIIDFLLKINENKLSLKDLELQLNKKKLINKHLAAPNGLYLERIWY